MQTQLNRISHKRRSIVGKALLSAKRALIGVGIFSFFINLLMLTGPIYMLQVYDRILSSRSMSTLVAISILMLVLYIFMGILELFRARVLTRLAYKFESDLGGKTFRIWLRQGAVKGSRDTAAPLTDLGILRQFLSGAGPSTFFDIPWVPIYLLVIFALHWALGIVALMGAVIIFGVALYNELSTKKKHLIVRKQRHETELLNIQTHRNSEAIEAMGMGKNLEHQWKSMQFKATQQAVLSGDVGSNASAFTKAFRMFIQSAILGVGGALAIRQIITPGAMIAGSIILGRALAPVQMAIGQWRGFNAARVSYRRLNQIHLMHEQEADTLQLPKPRAYLEAEHVMAGPPGAANATLMEINFKLKPGDGLGVVGPSASGKSTLARLLVGVWLPQKGAIRLDGATYDQWQRDDVGEFIGYLPQNVELFDGTVSQNIARFRPDASSEEIVLAAKKAGIHEMVLRLSDGYDTQLGVGGTVLSGGQVQRIALARALFGNPVLLVLDEPNSSLDTEGDMALSNAISIVRKQGTTVVVMAHRPSAIKALDTLLVLKDGRQIDYGPKDEVRERFSTPRQNLSEGNKK